MTATAPDDDLVKKLRAAGCVFAEDEATILFEEAGSAAELDRLVTRRVSGEPLEQVLGWAEFCGMRFAVAPGVFIPRQRTAALVDRAAAHATPATLTTRYPHAGSGAYDLGPPPQPAVVVDMCCGCGAIGAAVADRLQKSGTAVDVHAADRDPAAIRCAATNLAPYGGLVYEGDMFDALPDHLRGRVDVVVANVPYVPTRAVALLPPEARRHEALIALDGGDDGLAIARNLLTATPSWLARGGVAMFECDATQADAAAEAVRQAGLSPAVDTDLDREVTVITGTRPPSRFRDGVSKSGIPSWRLPGTME